MVYQKQARKLAAVCIAYRSAELSDEEFYDAVVEMVEAMENEDAGDVLEAVTDDN